MAAVQGITPQSGAQQAALTSGSAPRGFRYSAVASGVMIAVLASATFLIAEIPGTAKRQTDSPAHE